VSFGSPKKRLLMKSYLTNKFQLKVINDTDMESNLSISQEMLSFDSVRCNSQNVWRQCVYKNVALLFGWPRMEPKF
jgi:hypothetical protein